MSLFKPLVNLPAPASEGDKEKVPLRTRCVIIGSGPAGYTSAVYAARANLHPMLIKGLQPGGQLTTTNEVENFPGYPDGVSGNQLMEDLEKQAVRFGTEVLDGMVSRVDFSSPPFQLTVDDEYRIIADAVIIATGATAKYLGLESEEKFRGSGVSACATCDGFFYRGKDVAVVGGGDTACEEALYLAGICRKVYMIVRKDYLRASKIMQERVMRKSNIEVLFGRNTKELRGKQVLEEAVLIRNLGKADQTEETISIDGFFLAIGHTPNSDVFKPWIETDAEGYIITAPGTTKTSLPGVFACGDVQDRIYRQAVTAAGTGCQAAIEAERYLSQL